MPAHILALCLLGAAPLAAQEPPGAVSGGFPGEPPPGMSVPPAPAEAAPPQEPVPPPPPPPAGDAPPPAPEPPPPPPAPPANLSGMVLMPTAYRGAGLENDVGLGLDFNAAYYIGRLYGKNTLPWTLEKTDFIARIGQWFLTVDGKMQVQSEGRWRPALAAGALGSLAFRDAPQPALTPQAAPSVSASVDRSQQLGGAYLVASKRLGRRWIASLGYMHGTFPDMIPLLTEFLTPQALSLSGFGGATASADDMLFGGLILQTRRDRTYALEFMKPQGMLTSPTLVNLNLGSLLKLNFQLSYLAFDGGWDLLGMFQFRYSQHPK